MTGQTPYYAAANCCTRKVYLHPYSTAFYRRPNKNVSPVGAQEYGEKQLRGLYHLSRNIFPQLSSVYSYASCSSLSGRLECNHYLMH